MDSGLPPIEDLLTRLRDLQLPVTTTTAPGLTGAEMAALLRNFPLQLPEEVVHYYYWCNGTLPGQRSVEWFPMGYACSLADGLEMIDIQLEWLDPEQIPAWTSTTIVDRYAITTRPPLIWDRQWLPILGRGKDIWLTLCAEEAYATAPIYSLFLESDDLYLEYDSLTTLLLASLEAFTTGAYYLDEDGLLQQHQTRANAIINRYNPRRQAYYHWRAGVKDSDALLVLAMTPDEPHFLIVEQAMRRLADERLTASLLDYLTHPTAWVRTRSAYFLGQLGEQRAVDGLITLLHDSDEEVRIGAVRALGDLRNGRAVDALVDLLAHATGEFLYDVITNIGFLGDPRSCGALLPFLDHPDREVERRAIYALGLVGDERTLEPLREKRRDKDRSIHSTADDAFYWVKQRLAARKTPETE